MTEVNIDQARFNMIEQQIRPWDVLDPTVLQVVADTPRERFVPREYRNLAFSDTQIPIGHGQVMMEPKLEARILQTLSLQPQDRILEIGTGSGYLTACLARLGGEVISVELFPELSQHAQQQAAGLGLENIRFEVGDAGMGWQEEGTFDAVVVTGSLPVMTDAFRRLPKVGGRLFAIVGDGIPMDAQLITRVGEQNWTVDSLFETFLPPLLNTRKPQAFIF